MADAVALTLRSELERALAAHAAERIALVAADEPGARAVTYGELRALVGRLRAQLSELGVSDGQIVPILTRRTPEAVALTFAILLEGAAFCFVNERFRPEHLRFFVDKMSPAGVVVEHELPDALADFRPIQLTTTGLRTTNAAKRPGARSSRGAVEVHFSSGTSGRPKGALGTADGLHHFARTQIEHFQLTGNDKLLGLLSFSNNLGLVQMFTALFTGAELHLSHVTTPAEIGQRIRSAGITGISGSTGFWSAALAAAPGDAPLLGETPTLRYVSTAGAKVPFRLFLQLAERLGPRVAIHEIYGAAEIRQLTFFPEMTAPANRPHAGSVGRAVSGTRVFIARDRHTLAATGETGEVCYVGPGTMAGYLGDETLEGTKLGTHASVPGAVVVYSGDLGHLDSDGYLFLAGRASHRIETLGHQIWPSEIEEVLGRHPGVIEPIVFGVPDAERGQRIVAVVLAKEGITSAEIRTAAAGDLPDYKVPSSVSIWPSLPRTATGKPALDEIKNRYLRGESC